MSDSSRSPVRRLAFARLVSITGGEAAAVALAFTIYARTGSAIWLSTSFLFTFGAAGLVSPVAGTISDRFDRKRVMVACELVDAVAYAALVFVRAPAAMIAIAFLAEVAHAPFGPASAAAIPNLAVEGDITWANSLLALGSRIGRILGPVVGGGLLSLVGVGGVFGINALSFALSAALIAGVRGSYRSSTDEADDEYQGMWSGFAFTFGDGFLRSLCIAWAIMWFAVNIVVVADVPLVGAFGLGATALGLIYAFDSAGGIVGSIAARRVTPRWERVALIADMGAIALAYGVVSVSPWFVLVLVAVAFGLGVDTLAGIVGTTVIQRITPDAVRGRVFAAFGGLGMIDQRRGLLSRWPVAGPRRPPWRIRGSRPVSRSSRRSSCFRS